MVAATAVSDLHSASVAFLPSVVVQGIVHVPRICASGKRYAPVSRHGWHKCLLILCPGDISEVDVGTATYPWRAVVQRIQHTLLSHRSLIAASFPIPHTYKIYMHMWCLYTAVNAQDPALEKTQC